MHTDVDVFMVHPGYMFLMRLHPSFPATRLFKCIKKTLSNRAHFSYQFLAQNCLHIFRFPRPKGKFGAKMGKVWHQMDKFGAKMGSFGLLFHDYSDLFGPLHTSIQAPPTFASPLSWLNSRFSNLCRQQRIFTTPL